MKRLLQKYVPLVLIGMLLISAISLPTYAAECTVLDGYIKIGDTSGNVSVSGTTVTAKAADAKASAVTNTLTITNDTDSAATIYFSWSANGSAYTGSGTIVIDGVTYSQSGKTAKTGTFSKNIDAGSSIEVKVSATGKSYAANTVTLTLSGFTYTPVSSSYKVTINHATGGSVTLNGAAVTSSTSYDVSPTTGATLVATPASGYSFLGWVDSNNVRLSTSATYTITPTADISIRAAFASASKDAWFLVDDKFLTDSLTTAGALGSKIVLANDGTLAAGTYTIDAGDTLLVPYNSSNTLCTTAPTTTNSTYVTPTIYRTLTMASGANIIANGSISVSGSQNANYLSNGQPHGPLGAINMQDSSSIVVNGGGALYAWGYVAGSGSVTIKANASVYEDFQVRDYRGGNVTLDLANDPSKRMFPMSQYYIQNVQVPMRLEAGAIVKAYFSVSINYYLDTSVETATVPFIGSNSMFQITEGYIIKDYDEATDRLVIDVNGNLDLNKYTISIKTTIAGTATIQSQNYDLPINSNITVNLLNDSIVNVNQSILLMPGAEFNIGKNATMNITSGERMIVYDNDQWGLYCTDVNKALIPLNYVYGGFKYNRTTADLVDAKINVDGTLDASAGYLYTTAGGGNICSSNSGEVILPATSDSTAYQAVQKENGDDDLVDSEWKAHTITSAQLLNGDGKTYVATVASTTTPNTYTYDSTAGAWRCETHTDTDDDNTCDVCGYVLCAHENTKVLDAVESTCGETGLTEGLQCIDCEKILTEQEEIPALGHSYESVTVDATCTADGSTTCTCSVCGDSYSEPISALGHTASGNWLSDGTNHYKLCGICGKTTDTEACSGGTATCMTPATCEICKQSYGSVDSNNHNFSAEWSTDGSGHWKVCLNGCSVKGSEGNHSGGTANCQDLAVCETCQTAYGTTDSSNHKTVKTDAAQAPDCTNTGLTEGSHCEACNTVIVEQTTIEALGHAAGADATCTTAQTCIRCDYVFKAALGHSYTDYDSNGDAKCEVDGTETAKCDRCSETNTRTDEGSALGHSYTNYVANNNATCQSNGTETATCDNGCGGTVSRTIENSTVGHSYGEYVSDNNATCLNDGTQTAKCIWCGNTDTVTEAGSALGHNWSDYVSNGDATCLADGTKTRTCGREGCGVKETVTNEGSALGHSFTNYVPNADAVCGTDGTKTAKCDRCDATDTVTNEGSALDHQFTTYTYNDDAKCGANGTKTAECDYGCGETSTIADEGSALGHNFTYTSNDDATCTANGTKTGTCSRCDATDTREIPNSMLDHSYTNYVSDENATCTTDGTKTAQCDNCASTSTITDEGSMLAHSYGDWVVATPATCTEEGSSRRDCSSCDAFETRVDAATNHSMGDWYVSNAATCEISGEQRRNCSVCEYYETEVINALTHSYTSVTTQQPTCVDKGVETYTCSNCQNSYTQEIAATGAHTGGDPVREKVVEATCGEAGSYESVVYCTICNEALSRTLETIEATGEHNYESEVTKEATCIAVGERTYTCSVCNDAYTEEIKMVAHTISEAYTTENGKHFRACTTDGCEYVTEEAECSGGEATCNKKAACEICKEVYGELASENHTGDTTIKDASAATCTTPGYTGDTYCLGCNTKIADGESIAASGHGCTAVVTPPTCVTEGYTTYTCGTCGYSYTDDTTPATGEHTYVDGVCTGCGAEEVVNDPITVAYSMQAFLTLEAEVFMNVGFKLDNLNGINPEMLVDRVGILMWDAGESPENDAEVSIDLAEIILTEATWNESKSRFEVRTEGIPAKEMGDKLDFCAFYIRDDGSYTYGRVIRNYCPSKYCYGQLKDASTDDDALMIALLNYGASAQKLFNYRTDELMNAELTVEQQTINWDSSLVRSDWSIPAEKEGELTRNKTIITSRGGYLTLLGAIDYNYYIKVSDSIQIQSIKILCWTEKDYNANDVLTPQNASSVHDMEWLSEKGRYEFKYAGLAAKDMFSPIYTCAMVEDMDGNVYYGGVVPYCPERYAYINVTSSTATAADIEAAKCMVIYGDAARTYFYK